MKFKYKVEKNLDEEKLNEFGKQGWELVSVSYMLYFNQYDEHAGGDEWFYLKKDISLK